MLTLAAMINKADDIQERFNDFPARKRVFALYKHTRIMVNLMGRYRLCCFCCDCSRLMDSHREWKERCEFCDSPNIVSEFYC